MISFILSGSKETLNWGVRYKIILGTADGLLYLHENCQRRIIHRDIKADNILLAEDFEPQVHTSFLTPTEKNNTNNNGN